MGWLPMSVLLTLGVLLLALPVVVATRAVLRARRAARTLTVATTGRVLRVRAGVAEVSAWRQARRSGNDRQHTA
ncbi:phosphatidate phosphatase APP1 [Pseudonocardia eucalypti]|nr:phosphatidate phosphatase APP1 [Pseudonocardia eucalypti]